MLQNSCKTLGLKKNMVYKIPPGGRGGVWGAVLVFFPYLWISIIHLWISKNHLWISINHLWISINNYGYP